MTRSALCLAIRILALRQQRRRHWVLSGQLVLSWQCLLLERSAKCFDPTPTTLHLGSPLPRPPAILGYCMRRLLPSSYSRPNIPSGEGLLLALSPHSSSDLEPKRARPAHVRPVCCPSQGSYRKMLLLQPGLALRHKSALALCSFENTLIRTTTGLAWRTELLQDLSITKASLLTQRHERPEPATSPRTWAILWTTYPTQACSAVGLALSRRFLSQSGLLFGWAQLWALAPHYRQAIEARLASIVQTLNAECMVLSEDHSETYLLPTTHYRLHPLLLSDMNGRAKVLQLMVVCLLMLPQPML